VLGTSDSHVVQSRSSAMPGQGGRASRPLVSYKWEWDGAAVRKEDGLLHYRACRQVFRGSIADSILYAAGDMVFCCVEGDPMPWVAQCIDFCMGRWMTDSWTPCKPLFETIT
jgi:hypothetical protein